jgi:hypothetical protein
MCTLSIIQRALLLTVSALAISCGGGGADPIPVAATTPVATNTPASGSGATDQYLIGGTASGLNEAGLVLQNNGGNPVSITANGAFNFATPQSVGTAYNVTVAAQPAGLTCTVTNATGVTPAANVGSINVNCIAASAGGLLTGVKQVAAGAEFSLALKDDGTVWAWGSNFYPVLGNPAVTDISDIPVRVGLLAGMAMISAGYEHGLSLATDGVVWAWGHNNLGQLGDNTTGDRSSPAPVAGLSNVVAVAGGGLTRSRCERTEPSGRGV